VTLTAEQWRLLLAGECASCKLCGGTGERKLHQRGRRLRGGHRARSFSRARPCVACKRWRQLLDVLAREAVVA
jgi:hypothetical protein